MGEYRLSESDMEELRAAFFLQAGEILDGLPQQVLSVEKNPDEENWKALKRAFHTLKGDSKAMGFASLSTFAHKVEDLIAGAKRHAPDKKTIDLLFECSDSFKSFIDTAAAGGEPDVAGIVTAIDSHKLGGESWETKHVKHGPKGRDGGTSPFLRIEAGRVDRMMDLIGELVIGRSMLGQIVSDWGDMDNEEARSKIEGINSSIERSLSDLQRSVMKVRMLPIERVFKRFPRIARDLAAEAGKAVKLNIEGAETELDKSIIDSIGEPLLHIVRNSIDHGIEPPGARAQQGKPEEGTVTLRAFHQGSQIVIEVEDDGAGIDAEKIKETAVSKGLLSQSDAPKLGGKEAMELIFMPGLSTARSVTEVSGRGVGMDIVKSAVESMRGIIDIRTAKGRGTAVTLRLPLTLAIIKAILFKDGDETFALPLGSVTEILRAAPDEIETTLGTEVLRHRSGIVPLCSVRPRASAHPSASAQKKFIILIGVAQARAGVVADRIIGEDSLVIKALDEKDSSGIAAGASILGDGRVVVILDPLLLARKAGCR